MDVGFESFDQWRIERNEAVLKENYSGEPCINESVNEMSEEQLDFVLTRLISEIIRERTCKSIQRRLYMK